MAPALEGAAAVDDRAQAIDAVVLAVAGPVVVADSAAVGVDQRRSPQALARPGVGILHGGRAVVGIAVLVHRDRPWRVLLVLGRNLAEIIILVEHLVDHIAARGGIVAGYGINRDSGQYGKRNRGIALPRFIVAVHKAVRVDDGKIPRCRRTMPAAWGRTGRPPLSIERSP